MGFLEWIYDDPSCKSYKGSTFFTRWSVGFNTGAIWAKGGGGYGRKARLNLGKKNEVVLDECGDNFGGRLHWESGAREDLVS